MYQIQKIDSQHAKKEFEDIGYSFLSASLSLEQKFLSFMSTHDNVVVYINITNGIEFLPTLEKYDIEPKFCSIQSTHLEQKELDPILIGLGSELLMDLAQGKNVLIIDYGTRKEISRAVYQGIPFIKFCLEKIWYGYTPEELFIIPRKEDARPLPIKDTYEKWFHLLNRKTKRHLSRFSDLAISQDMKVHITGISASTEQDGHRDFYVKTYREWQKRYQRL